MDIFSYILGKKAGGGGGGSKLQKKTITISEDGTTILTPDTGYDGFNEVTVIVEQSGILPSAYQAVEYIGANGTQCINTGVNTTSEIKIDLDILQTSSDSKALYGGGIGWQNKYIQGEGDSISYFAFNNSTYSINIPFQWQGQKNIIQDKNVIKVDGSNYYSFPYSQFETEFPIYLFATNRGGEITEHGTFELKQCKIYENDVIVRNFYPCYRKVDEVIGLYDIVNGVFYTNQGTGEFTKGQNIEI